LHRRADAGQGNLPARDFIRSSAISVNYEGPTMRFLAFAFFILLNLPPAHAPDGSIEGKWTFIKEKSTDLAAWRSWSPQLEIATQGDVVTITHQWLERNQVVHTDSFAFRPGANPSTIPVHSVIWTDNWFMGVLAKKGIPVSVSGIWVEPGKAIRTVSEQVVEISQGETNLTTTREYRLDPTGTLLTLTEQRASRPTTVILMFQRSEAK
jgi:hypothetical protein